MSWFSRRRHWWLALTVVPRLITGKQQRQLLVTMRRFVQQLPSLLQAPLPEAMAAISTSEHSLSLNSNEVRQLADLAALLERGSPLGICLRRSLVRFHFLQQTGLPIQLIVGARFSHGRHADSTVNSHAWTTVGGRPYHEVVADYEPFTPIFHWPPESESVTRQTTPATDTVQ